MKNKPMRAEADVIREIERLVEEWNEAIEKGNYTKAAKKSYIRYIKMFLNFCKGGFTSSKVYENTQKSDLNHSSQANLAIDKQDHLGYELPSHIV